MSGSKKFPNLVCSCWLQHKSDFFQVVYLETLLFRHILCPNFGVRRTVINRWNFKTSGSKCKLYIHICFIYRYTCTQCCDGHCL
jgi:hypothetical protein